MPLIMNGSYWESHIVFVASVLKFYEANGFKTLFSSEKQEKEYIGLPPEKELKTRIMFYDLIRT
jgi:hypothetical protein